MSVSTLAERELVRATKVYPAMDGALHSCIVHTSGSQVPHNPRQTLHWDEELKNSVLASAFYPTRTILNLPEGMGEIVLPVVGREEFREHTVYNQHQQVWGRLLHVPGFYVQANRILHNVQIKNWNYDYRYALGRMAFEAARLVTSMLRRFIYRVRQHPGVMASIIAFDRLGPDQVGISEEFAGDLFRQLQREGTWKELVPNVGRLDNFPTWTIRFPLANAYGVQPLHLKILPGRGRYVGLNRWNLEHRFLGDEDGDPGFILLRTQELREGRAEMGGTPRFLNLKDSPDPRAHISLDGLMNLDRLPVTEKQRDRLKGLKLDSLETRLAWIREADTRSHVATYTMFLGWYVPRVLALSGMNVEEAHIKGYTCLKFFMETCMDARKGLGTFSGFDNYGFMDTLRRGGIIDWNGLAELGVPEESLQVLKSAWEASAGNLRGACSQSPVYDTAIVRRGDMENAMPEMLRALFNTGVRPEDLYMTIIKDLQCMEFTHWVNSVNFPPPSTL